MKLACYRWNTVLEWDALHPAELILESPREYLRIVDDLTQQDGDGEGELIFSEENKIYSLKKDGMLVRDLWNTDLNQKKILNGIYQHLSSLVQEEHYAEYLSVRSNIDKLIQDLALESMLSLEWDVPWELSPMLKMAGVRMEVSEEPFDRLIDYMEATRDFLSIKFTVLIGIRSFLTDTEFQELCRNFSCMGISVLFVEPYCRQYLQDSIRLIIDSDHCEIRIG